MTSLAYGLDAPYEVQLEHRSATSNHTMVILDHQRTPEQSPTRHYLTPGVYMVSLTYNGAPAVTLEHISGGVDNKVTVPAGTAGSPRTSAPIKISVQSTTEYLHVAAVPAGSARATISVIPADTFDEMAESAQGVSVLSEISNLKSTKADKSTLDARVPTNTSLRLDTSVGTRIFAGNTMIYGDTGWRNIAADLMNGWTVSDLQIRRIGSIVQLRGYELDGRNATSDLVFKVPIGFGHAGWGWYAPLTEGNTLLVNGSREAKLTAGSRYFYGGYHTSATVMVNDKWPSALPGTPA